MKVKRHCESCGKEFEWENECRCGKNKHSPICSPCSKIRWDAFYKNFLAIGSEEIMENIEKEVFKKFNG